MGRDQMTATRVQVACTLEGGRTGRARTRSPGKWSWETADMPEGWLQNPGSRKGLGLLLELVRDVSAPTPCPGR